MSNILPRNYQIGTCFICQTCMYCGINLITNNCNCDKTVKPTKKNRTQDVPNFRNLSYKPDKVHEEVKKIISSSNQKYGYKLNMELGYNCILCSACNSQMNRDVKTADKDKKVIIISPSTDDDSLQSLSQPNTSSSQVEFKIRLSIKQNKKVLPFVVANFSLENPNFTSFQNKLESYICEQVGLVYSNEYALAYKSHSENGAGTLLQDEDAFGEFLKDYQSMIAGNKRVIIIVTLNDLPKKRLHQVFIILRIILSYYI